MSKVFNSIIDNCIARMYNDEEIKAKLEKDVLNPLIHKAYGKSKPYIYIILYMYGVIVLLLVIIILLILFRQVKSI